MDRMMTSDSHSKGSERDHKRGQNEKDAMENGMRMSAKEQERKNVEVVVQPEVLMEMLQRNEMDHKYGYVMRKKVKWQRLQEKREQQVNMQILKETRELEQVIQKLKRVELQQKEDVEEDVEVSICEPERGPLVFESDEQP